jgi:S1/P1 Nuclease
VPAVRTPVPGSCGARKHPGRRRTLGLARPFPFPPPKTRQSLAQFAPNRCRDQPHKCLVMQSHGITLSFHREMADSSRELVRLDGIAAVTLESCKNDPEQGDCIINALDRVQKSLADCTKPNAERLEALKFLVHFAGDVLQPLHKAERNGDHGGNDVQVTFLGKNVKLHAVWDTEIIMHTVFAWGTYVSRLEEKWFPGRDLSGSEGGTPVDWALDSHKLTHDVAYDFPNDTHLGMDSLTSSWRLLGCALRES